MAGFADNAEHNLVLLFYNYYLPGTHDQWV